MNLLLFTEADRVDGEHIKVTDRRLQHLREVHGAREGDTLRAGQVNGMLGDATITELGKEQAVLRITLSQTPPAKLPLVLVLALPRPKMLRRIFRAVAELGVPELHLINSYRVEKSFWQTPVLQADIIENYLLQGLEQSRDTMLPTVSRHRRFKPFVEDTLPGLIGERRALLAHPGDYPPCPSGLESPALLIIGPEGGFIRFEVEKFQDAGCEPITLGRRILRVETAVTALVSKLF